MNTNKDITILVFGDSIVYGALDTRKGGWVNRLRLSLENEYSNKYFNIYNLGIPGEKTSKVKKRFNFECLSRYNKNDNTIIIFSIGINDTQILNNKDMVEALKTFKNNVIDLINNAKQFTNNILFVGLTPVDESKTTPISWNIDKSYLNEKIIEFDQTLEKTCLTNNINYVKTFDLLTIKDLSDGVHPNSIGHDKLSNKIKKVINNFL